MTILDIPLPQGSLTRPQVRRWADKVCDTFIDFLAEQEFEGYVKPSEDDPIIWTGVYQYESMSVVDKMALLIDVPRHRYQVARSLNNAGASSNTISIFSFILDHLPNESEVEHLNMTQVRSIILNILFLYTKCWDRGKPNDGNEKRFIPPVAKKDYSYFYELFYEIIDNLIESILETTPQAVQVLQDMRLYQAEKAGSADAIKKRGNALQLISDELDRNISSTIRDMEISSSFSFDFVHPMRALALNGLYEIIPTLVTRDVAKRKGFDNQSIQSHENALSKLIYRAFSDTGMPSKSPACKQMYKAFKPYDQQTQIKPSDEPYETPQS